MKIELVDKVLRFSFKGALEKSRIKEQLEYKPTLSVAKYSVKFKALDGSIVEFETNDYYYDYNEIIKKENGIMYKGKTYPLSSICWFEVDKVEDTTHDLYYFIGYMLRPITKSDINKDNEKRNYLLNKAKELDLL